MKMPRPKFAIMALSLVFVVGAVDALSARPKTQRVTRSPTSTAVQTCSDGTPIIMQGLPCRTGPAQNLPYERAERPVRIPRGSSGYLPPVPSPGPSSLTPQAPRVAPYVPPPINSFSDRVIQCNQSFTFNGGVGLNPANRDAYVRSCAN